jgi:hypothetical protein
MRFSLKSSKSSKDEQMLMGAGIAVAVLVVLFLLYKLYNKKCKEDEENYSSIKTVNCDADPKNPDKKLNALCEANLSTNGKQVPLGVKPLKALKDYTETAANGRKLKNFATCNTDKDCPPPGVGFDKGCVNKVCLRWKNPEAVPYRMPNSKTASD